MRGFPRTSAHYWMQVYLPEETFCAVKWFGRVDDETLHRLYAGAACLAVPSLYEGFGMSALEAMASGCPVVTGNVGAPAEVCGDAAVLVDPLEVEAITRGIEQGIDRADELRALGQARAAGFTWAAAAERLVGVYRSLVPGA